MNLHTDYQSLHAALTLMTGVIYCEKIMAIYITPQSHDTVHAVVFSPGYCYHHLPSVFHLLGISEAFN